MAVHAERRRSRVTPQARLRPGWIGFHAGLMPGVWYTLQTNQAPNPLYVWLKTPDGAIAWLRDDLELRGAPV